MYGPGTQSINIQWSLPVDIIGIHILPNFLSVLMVIDKVEGADIH